MKKWAVGSHVSPADHLAEPWKASFRQALFGDISVTLSQCTVQFLKVCLRPEVWSMYIFSLFWMWKRDLGIPGGNISQLLVILSHYKSVFQRNYDWIISVGNHIDVDAQIRYSLNSPARATMASLSCHLLHVASCNFSFQRLLVVVNRRVKTCPQHRTLDVWRLVSSSTLPVPLQAHISGAAMAGLMLWPKSTALFSVQPDETSSQTFGCSCISITVHSNVKSTRLMRISRVLGKAVGVGKGAINFLTLSCPGRLKAGSSGQGPGPSGDRTWHSLAVLIRSILMHKD